MKYKLDTTTRKLVEFEEQNLTQAQQAYFKDSKMRDDDGDLIYCFHYTDHEFDAFDVDKIGSSQGDIGYCGKGIYFTSMTTFGTGFGHNVLECYINMTNPLIVQDLDDWDKESLLEYFASSEEYKCGDLPRIEGYPQDSEQYDRDDFINILEHNGYYFDDEEVQALCEELMNSYEYGNFKDSGNIEDLEGSTEFEALKENDKFMRVIKDKCLESYLEITEQRWDEKLGKSTLKAEKFHRGYWADFAAQLTEWAKDHGYDGILDHAPYHGSIREIVVFEPNQIKLVSNLYPTKDDNFRDNSQAYLKENLKNMSLEEQRALTKHIKNQNQQDSNKTRDKSKSTQRGEAVL